MTTKYDINEKVHTMYSNKATILKINRITIEDDKSVEYTLDNGKDNVYKKENQIFKTKSDLIDSL